MEQRLQRLVAHRRALVAHKAREAVQQREPVLEVLLVVREHEGAVVGVVHLRGASVGRQQREHLAVRQLAAEHVQILDRL